MCQTVSYGAADIITVGDGNDVIMGGLGDDQITVGNGNSDVIGDDGQLLFTAAGLLISAATINPSYGGNDTIKLGTGSDIVFGGFGNDIITAGTGKQIIVGDNGSLTYSVPGVVQTVTSSRPAVWRQRHHHRR